MLNSYRNTFAALLLSISVLSSYGCVALLVGAAAGAAGAVYIQGNLEKNFDNSVKTVHKTAMSVMEAQDIFITTEELNEHNAKIKGEYADGEEVTVIIEALTEKASKVKIRIGLIGDETKSHTLMNALQKKF